MLVATPHLDVLLLLRGMDQPAVVGLLVVLVGLLAWAIAVLPRTPPGQSGTNGSGGSR